LDHLPADPFIKSKRGNLYELETVEIRGLRIDKNVSFHSLGLVEEVMSALRSSEASCPVGARHIRILEPHVGYRHLKEGFAWLRRLRW
jgi:hypothetical protein